MKYFISQPVGDRLGIIVKAERKRIETLIRQVDNEAEIIDSYISSFPQQVKRDRLWALGKVLARMNQADVVVFANGWEDSFGCTLEHQCAEHYQIPFMTQCELEKQAKRKRSEKFVVKQRYQKL